MSSYTQVATIYPSFYSEDSTSIPSSKDKLQKTIVIDDIKDVAINGKTSVTLRKYMALAGILPNPQTTSNIVEKSAIALVLSAIFSVWVSNSFLYLLFIITAIVNLISSFIIDRDESWREKVGHFVSDLVLTSFSVVIIQVVLGDVIDVPLNLISISTVGFVLTLFIVSNTWVTIRRLLPLSTLFQSGTLQNLVGSLALGWRTGWDNFQSKQKISQD